ncbi:hypothetical protein C8Q80DRAFT_1099585 [Daedaleopsis nitida]|nr:hypothetical protein C8Q80DRAFT_1099585 [Daedaleopsis nitida]
MLDSGAKGSTYAAFLDVVRNRLQILEAPLDVNRNATSSLASWKTRARDVVQAVVNPQVMDWMDDADDSQVDVAYIIRCLEEINMRFERDPVWNDATEALQDLAKQLGALSCFLFHDNVSCSPAANANKEGVCFVATYLKVAFRMLENEDTRKVHHNVYVAVYDALAKSLRHQTALLDDRLFEDLATFIGRGMKAAERVVRMAAGRTLVELIRFVQRTYDRPKEPVVATFQNRLVPLLKNRDSKARETTILTIGHIGKISPGPALRESLCALVQQLGTLNPIHKGTAVLQLHSLAKHYKKSPFSLTMPYLDRIAPILARRLITEPDGISEFCNFISMTPASFLKLTLRHTLPRLFADNDLKGLQAVSDTVQEKEASKLGFLVLENSAYILSHVFMLQGVGQTNRALQLILTLMQGDVHNPAAVTIPSIIRSCLVNLLTELVAELGDEDADVTEAANDGLRKLTRVLQGDAERSVEVSAKLKDQMLGIITTLNDMVQEVREKKTPESKQKILRSFGEFARRVGKDVSNVGPQIMATLQTMVLIPELSDATLYSWYWFLFSLDSKDLGSHVGSTTASFVARWSTFSPRGREVAKRCLNLLIVERGAQLGDHLAEIADLSSIPELYETNQHLAYLRAEWTPYYCLTTLLDRLESESLPIAIQSAAELKTLLLDGDEELIRSLTAGDFFDPIVGRLIAALYAAACRDGENTEILHDLALDCIGIVGAIDPDRFELPVRDSHMVILSNYAEEEEATDFALHLIRDVLVNSFRSTSDVKYQSHLAFAIQELLQFCKFSISLAKPGSNTSSVPLRARTRWSKLPRIVVETCTPLLEKPLHLAYPAQIVVSHPIYPTTATYRQWVQGWTSHLIHNVSGDTARQIFRVFSPVVRSTDVGVARHLLPHLVLNVLAYGEENAAQSIRTELVTVLEDQVNPNSSASADKKLLCAQAVFMLLDHLTKYLREIRLNIARQKADAKRSRTHHEIMLEGQEQLVRVESILTSIDDGLMAKAAFQCKAYARTLMNLEQHIIAQRERKTPTTELQDHYERLHEIYAYLDEPDGMEGVSTVILSPSLEHQIRQHESTGRWTSAQSCWEVRLQHDPDNLDYHLGLLRCLRNLGHYVDSLRTHVKGVLTSNPDWGPQLLGYHVESEWMVGHWEEVQKLVSESEARPPLVLMAQVLLAMRSSDEEAITALLSTARRALGVSITASSSSGYRRSYEAVLDLHLMHELEIINRVVKNLPNEMAMPTQVRDKSFDKLLQRLAARFDSTLPSFRIREPILNMRRTAFNLNVEAKDATGQLWLTSAKIARKAGHSQTAYSAILQAQRSDAPFPFIESARLVRARGEPLRALQELENSMKLLGFLASQQGEDVIDLTTSPDDTRMKAKAHSLHARWMADSGRFEDSKVHKEFLAAAEMWPKWESGQFHLGQFQDECYKALSPDEKKQRGMRMNLQTVRAFTRAIRYGSKYIYQTLPRVLTIWLDIAEDEERARSEIYPKINAEVQRAIKQAPVYKWYTAFPQIVSRIGVKNQSAYDILSLLLQSVIQEYPKQALWPFTAVLKSTSSARAKRSRAVLQKMRMQTTKHSVAKMVSSMAKLTEELLKLCRAEVKEAKVMSMSRTYKDLYRMFKPEDPSHDILIPLQESLTANLPPQSASENTHQPFPVDAPTFVSFFDEVEVMNSLAKPKKMSIKGSNGQIFTFLGKKDDLRKDGRLMDFDSILNKLLKSDSEARRRQLRIRTYSVVSLNEECGLIQWVPNTIPVRSVLTALYTRRGQSLWNGEVRLGFEKLKATPVKEVGEVFVREVLSLYPPVMHEWFAETFPEPSSWLSSRMSYSRTAAVMSMVGYILGLGDRHCENILLDTNCGDIVHVDFDCLFEKGHVLETPEIVPFRLTQNMVDALGVTGVEGVFRIACEVTLRLLRQNKDCLMNVLDAFVHDPLVEWEEKRRRLERSNNVVDIRAVSQDALGPIEEKLQGLFKAWKAPVGKQLSVSNHVQSLIHQATDNTNLARMYIGWAPHQ